MNNSADQAVGRVRDAQLVSVVIPTYRSSDTLPRLVRQIADILEALAIDYEIILVDDCSSDSTWTVIRELQCSDPGHITAIELMRNVGQHNALMCGFKQVRGNVVVTMDDDLQNPPAEIPKLVAALDNNHLDLIYGVPESRQHHQARNVGSRLVGSFFRLVFRLQITPTSFRALRRQLLDSVLSYDLNFTYIDGLFAWNTTRIGEVAVEHHARHCGRSGYSFAKLVTLALNLFTNFSLLPLQVASIVGLIASVLGLSTGAYFLAQALLSKIAVPGFASIIVAVMTLGGLQLLALGIIGEYIGRVHLNLNRKPQYTIRTVQRGNSHVESLDQDGRASEEMARV